MLSGEVALKNNHYYYYWLSVVVATQGGGVLVAAWPHSLEGTVVITRKIITFFAYFDVHHAFL